MLSSVPQWLEKAHRDPSDINHALSILAERERARSRARSSTRGVQISLKPRLPHVPLLSYPKSQLADHYSVSQGCRPENQWSNRYMDIEPYDRTCAKANSRYFNGNWVRELFGGSWWIATQAPLPGTAHEFFSMVSGLDTLRPPGEPAKAYKRVRTIVQLTREVEDGRRKADAYFPSRASDSLVVTPPDARHDLAQLRVTLVKSEAIAVAHCTSSTISISTVSKGIAQAPVVVHHLLFHAWPDHGVPNPEDRAGLLHFIRLTDRVNRDISSLTNEPNPDRDPPIMVHCSAGVGRTGAFIALTSLLRVNGLLAQPSSSHPGSPSSLTAPLPPSPLGTLPDDIRDDKVAQEIDSLREQRPGMVQRPEQALLVYEVLYTAFLSRDQLKATGKTNGSSRA
ncbi:protein-tyrosine phosphatase-like protein [Vararia minispora EC-137]|uniref:Protein-tyrosine phosphatase-like protein n=1 Tax=Vararia minispora EC-137 TaxID=1314806 RepID=A0ACB8QI15_9AGAM|nr:protein-tyrosine phosphatase-like protein [Vararia minispora EC-137]